MTRREWNKLQEGDKVWVDMPYLAYKMPGVVRTIDHQKGIWINFFGDGQTHLCPTDRHKLWSHVERYEEPKDAR